MKKLIGVHAAIVGLALISLATWPLPSKAQAYCCQDTGKVGYVQVSGSRSGVAVWSKKDGSVFPSCTNSANQMWIEPDTSVVTEAAARSMLATLLMAKSVDQTVTVYYAIRSDGVCAMRHVGVN